MNNIRQIQGGIGVVSPKPPQTPPRQESVSDLCRFLRMLPTAEITRQMRGINLIGSARLGVSASMAQANSTKRAAPEASKAKMPSVAAAGESARPSTISKCKAAFTGAIARCDPANPEKINAEIEAIAEHKIRILTFSDFTRNKLSPFDLRVKWNWSRHRSACARQISSARRQEPSNHCGRRGH